MLIWALGLALANEPSAVEQKLMKDHEVVEDRIFFRMGKGLMFRSKDGIFAFRLRVRGQFRWAGDFYADGAAEQAFQVRRARLVFAGNMGKHNHFKVELAMSPRDMGLDDVRGPDGGILFERTVSQVPVLDWYAYFTYLRDFEVRAGQKKVPFSRQRVVSSGNQQFVDRSIVNGEFNLDRDLGIEFRSEDVGGLGLLRYRVGFGMGEGRNLSDSAEEILGFDFLYHARIDILPNGLFSDYREVDFDRSNRFRIAMGFGYAFLQDPRFEKGILGEVISPEWRPVWSQHGVFDGMMKIAGVSMVWEYQLRTFDRSVIARNGWGLNLQLGYLVPKSGFEVATRYALIRPMGVRSNLLPSNELLGALNYYVAQHALKLQLDVGQVWSTDIRGGATTVRLQLQVSN